MAFSLLPTKPAPYQLPPASQPQSSLRNPTPATSATSSSNKTSTIYGQFSGTAGGNTNTGQVKTPDNFSSKEFGSPLTRQATAVANAKIQAMKSDPKFYPNNSSRIRGEGKYVPVKDGLGNTVGLYKLDSTNAQYNGYINLGMDVGKPSVFNVTGYDVPNIPRYAQQEQPTLGKTVGLPTAVAYSQRKNIGKKNSLYRTKYGARTSYAPVPRRW